MPSIYKYKVEGEKWGKEEVGSYEDGIIHPSQRWLYEYGEYIPDKYISDKGRINEGLTIGIFSSTIGRYDNGIVYAGDFNEPVGEYERGKIYRGTGYRRIVIGEYEGDNGGAAAALLLLLKK